MHTAGVVVDGKMAIGRDERHLSHRRLDCCLEGCDQVAPVRIAQAALEGTLPRYRPGPPRRHYTHKDKDTHYFRRKDSLMGTPAKPNCSRRRFSK